MRTIPSLFVLMSGAAASSAITSYTSISPVPPPPERLALEWHVRTDRYGHARSAGYFTEEQLHDAAWEFQRLQGPVSVLCIGTPKIVHRDVQWFASANGSSAICARVTYTVQCVALNDHSNPVPPDSLLATRTELLARPAPDDLGADCGEKDVEVRQRKGLDPVRDALPPGNQIQNTIATPPPPVPVAPPAPVRPRQ